MVCVVSLACVLILKTITTKLASRIASDFFIVVSLSAGTFHPFCVTCPDTALKAFWIRDNIWLLIASLNAL